MYSLEGKRVWVAGHRGMVGAALVRRLQREHPAEIITVTRAELDLTNQASTSRWIEDTRPDAVFVPAAKVGGIYANDSYPAEFLYQNLMIAANIIHASHTAGVEKLLFLGSSCIYPKFADQPIREEALLTGDLEPTNEWYAIAKIAGIKLCQSYRKQYGADFISAMPTNLYGPGDNYHPMNSHVIPALIRKAHEAKLSGAASMEIWGSGTPRREFLHVDDCADALVHLMKVHSDAGHINVGSGEDLPIEDLAREIMSVVGFDGELTKDTSKPDGTPRKLMSADKIRALGWTPSIKLREGLEDAYAWFRDHELGS
ncbi:GDP-fucose synthetase [Maricaulis sp. W15]|uniref:GDP-L-fucose synthase n=1 Tax=Maricaulis maris TaxID=74318 RepID=A0A495DLE4_9PROT|nr:MULTISPECIES: GDP-L-fucose synthase [Maricaulis]OLF81334.1 GDP-fucose synthetase [Maricaulis sp. W15]RKR03734.1 GDP-L-fucose synthase [Maricaulis maris]